MYFDKLISIREYNNLTQKQLANILHTSQSNYSRWERSVELMPLKKLSLLCNYFKLNID